MRSPRRDPWPPPPEFEHIARFGDAEIVKDLRGRLSIRGGTPENQAAARAWQAQFLSGPKLTPPCTVRRAAAGDASPTRFYLRFPPPSPHFRSADED